MIMDIHTRQRSEGEKIAAAPQSPVRSGMLLNWLKDPRNRFMYEKDISNSSDTVMEKLDSRAKEIRISECPSPTSEFEHSNGTTTRESSDSDIWDVSSLDTPTLRRKPTPKDRIRRKTTSFKGCKHNCNKLRRRHTCGTTSRDILVEETGLSGDTNCQCQNRFTGLSPSMLELFVKRGTKRHSFTDSDSGIIDSDFGKDRLSPISDTDMFHVQVPLDEIARKGNIVSRSKSEASLHSKSILTGIYKDIDTQNELEVHDFTVAKQGKFSISRKYQSLKEPLRKLQSKDVTEDNVKLFRTKSLFDLSGKDPESEADFFFGVKTKQFNSDLSIVKRLDKSLSKSCSDLQFRGSLPTDISQLYDETSVVQEEDVITTTSRHAKTSSLPSLRVRALRGHFVKEEHGMGRTRRHTRLRLGSLETQGEKTQDETKRNSLIELREKLKSIDITDLVGKSDSCQVDDNGNTLLHYAAAQGNDKLIKTILSEGASVWTPNKFGHLPIELSGTFRSASFLSQSTLFYGHGANMVRQGHLHPKSVHYEL